VQPRRTQPRTRLERRHAVYDVYDVYDVSDDTVVPERSLSVWEKIYNIDGVRRGAVMLPLALAMESFDALRNNPLLSRRRPELEAHIWDSLERRYWT
jgi:hypothetical protein